MPRGALGPQFGALFHASPHEFQPGDIIQPPSARGSSSSSFGGGGLAFAAPDRRLTSAYEAKARAQGLPARTYRVEPVANDAQRFTPPGSARHDFTQVASPTGFRVLGPAGPASSPVQQTPRVSMAPTYRQTRQALMANPNDAAARMTAQSLLGRTQHFMSGADEELI